VVTYGISPIILLLLFSCTLPPGLIPTIDYPTTELSYDRTKCGNAPFPFWFNPSPLMKSAR